MKLEVDDKSKKIYSNRNEKYDVSFLFLDAGKMMGGYLNEKILKTGMTVEKWKVMQIEVKLKKSNKTINAEHFLDETGRHIKTVITDENGMKRIRIYYDTPSSLAPIEERNSLRNKGYTIYNNRWVQDTIIVKEYDDSTETTTERIYCYDYRFDKFLDQEGNEAPKSILCRYDLPKIMTDMGLEVEKSFNSSYKNHITPKEINDANPVDVDVEV